MALGKLVADIILDLHQRDFFKKINSVIDMGDQDVAIVFSEIKKRFERNNIKFDENLWHLSKKFPNRPRVSASIFWKSLGIKTAERIDLVKLERDKNDNNKHIIHDLNLPLQNKDLFGKYDLVTDIGNNEHPFNIVEAYRTMHNLCKNSGYMMIYQAYLNGNGYYRFDDSSIDNVAAANNYSIIHSCFVINHGEKSITIPLDRKYLKLINLNNLDNICMFYLLKKNNSEEFKFPYQGGGKEMTPKEFFTLKTHYESRLPNQIYLPSKVEDINTKVLIRALIKKIFKI